MSGQQGTLFAASAFSKRFVPGDNNTERSKADDYNPTLIHLLSDNLGQDEYAAAVKAAVEGYAGDIAPCEKMAYLTSADRRQNAALGWADEKATDASDRLRMYLLKVEAKALAAKLATDADLDAVTEVLSAAVAETTHTQHQRPQVLVAPEGINGVSVQKIGSKEDGMGGKGAASGSGIAASIEATDQHAEIRKEDEQHQPKEHYPGQSAQALQKKVNRAHNALHLMRTTAKVDSKNAHKRRQTLENNFKDPQDLYIIYVIYDQQGQEREEGIKLDYTAVYLRADDMYNALSKDKRGKWNDRQRQLLAGKTNMLTAYHGDPDVVTALVYPKKRVAAPQRLMGTHTGITAVDGTEIKEEEKEEENLLAPAFADRFSGAAALGRGLWVMVWAHTALESLGTVALSWVGMLRLPSLPTALRYIAASPSLTVVMRVLSLRFESSQRL